MMKVPAQILKLLHALAFPLLISLAWFFGYTDLGAVIISAQLTIVSVQLQTSFWSESDHFEVQRFLFKK